MDYQNPVLKFCLLVLIITTHHCMLLQTRSILSDILPQMVDADQNLTSSMILSLNRFFLSSLLWGGSLAMWEYHSFSDNNISIIHIISQNQWKHTFFKLNLHYKHGIYLNIFHISRTLQREELFNMESRWKFENDDRQQIFKGILHVNISI